MMAYLMSKTITAAAVLQLVEAGKVALDSPVVRYVDSTRTGLGSRCGNCSRTLRHTQSHPSAGCIRPNDTRPRRPRGALATVFASIRAAGVRAGRQVRLLETSVLAARERRGTGER
jgi:hypothetical protein